MTTRTEGVIVRPDAEIMDVRTTGKMSRRRTMTTMSAEADRGEPIDKDNASGQPGF